MDTSSGPSQPPRFELFTGAPPDAELILVSTSAHGTPGALNQYVLQQLKLPLDILPDEIALQPGFAVMDAGPTKLVFVVTVGIRKTRELLETNLDRALSATLTPATRSLWIPLMGTGAGGMSHLESLQVTLQTLERHRANMLPDIRVAISAPPNLSEAEYSSLHRAAYGPGHVRESILHSLDADVLALLDAAALLRDLRNTPMVEVSTTVFLLTLTVADKFTWPNMRVIPPNAKRFARFARARAGTQHQLLWSGYFRIPLEDVETLEAHPEADSPALSRNMMYWINTGLDVARSNGRSRATLDDLIQALSQQQYGNVRHALARLGFTVDEFFRDAVGAGVASDSTPVTPRMLNDQATLDDKLGFSRYVEAMAQFMLSAQTTGPLSISVEAPWGYGKSSLMSQLRQRLDPNRRNAQAASDVLATFRRAMDVLFRKRDYVGEWTPSDAEQATLKAETWTVWFNAWKYENTEQVWSGLMDALIKEISARLPPAERELFLFRLNLSRIDDGLVRRRMHERLAQAGWSVFRWALSSFAMIVLALKATVKDTSWVFGVGAAWIPLSILFYLARRRKIMQEPAKFSLAEFFRVPDYQKHAGILHQIQSDLDNVLNLARQLHRAAGGGPFRIAVFVDDLDRCAPTKIASVVEGINSFLASERSEFFFIIGMDPQIVASALDHAHKDLRTQLPQLYRQTPLGWRFMDKFIQLPFTIPARHDDYTDSYLSAICAAVTPPVAPGSAAAPATHADAAQQHEVGANSVRPSQVEPDGPTGDVRAPAADTAPLAQVNPTVAAENADVRTVLNAVMARSHCSPREIKRVLNVVRFVLHLRVARIVTGKKVPPLRAYATWIVLGLRWPELVRWLEWGFGDLRTPTETDIKNRLANRLHVFEQLAAAHPFDGWGQELRKQLNKPDEVLWTQDTTLYQFLREEAELEPASRLSIAAEIGLF